MATMRRETLLKVELVKGRLETDLSNEVVASCGHTLRVSGQRHGELNISFRRTIRVVSYYQLATATCFCNHDKC